MFSTSISLFLLSVKSKHALHDITTLCSLEKSDIEFFFRKNKAYGVCELAMFQSSKLMMHTLGSNGRFPRRQDGASRYVSQSLKKPEEYSEGPSDLSLLVRYEHYCARRLWYEHERGAKKELKRAAHS
ncbi:hypothetical protein RYX36_035083 [Vicia faba]